MRTYPSENTGWWRKLRIKFRQIAFYEHWMIGIVDAPLEASLNWLVCPSPRWLNPQSQKYYLADPFAWPGDPKIILCEEYDFATGRGSIVRLTLGPDSILQKIPVKFSLPGHLSFPFLFAHEGNVYCLPESGNARRMVIFRWEENHFKEYAAPLSGVSAADSILFTHDGIFWIAYTDTGIGTADNLNLLFASDLKGPWTAHPANPVKRSRSDSRNAGPVFQKDGTLYRPAQDCSQTYGGAIRIQRILECTKERYREEDVVHIAPEDGRHPHGLHTLSSLGNQTLIDGKRMIFSVSVIFRKAWKRLGGL